MRCAKFKISTIIIDGVRVVGRKKMIFFFLFGFCDAYLSVVGSIVLINVAVAPLFMDSLSSGEKRFGMKGLGSL